MADQLDLFNASRTTTYRNTHRTVQRRLKTKGSGKARVERMVNRTNGHQSLRANGSKVRNLAKNLRRLNVKVKSTGGRRGGVRASTGHSGG